MIYKELKYLILRQIANSKGEGLTASCIYAYIQSEYPEEKGVRKKTYWALNELFSEKQIVQKEQKIFLKQTIRGSGFNNLLGKKFERECKRLLELVGFYNVRVFGKAGDRGVDGKADLHVHELFKMSFFFQCKNTQDKTGSRAIREFRGSIVGRCAAGIYFAAGGFTKEARSSVKTNHNPPIYLVDQSVINKMNKDRYN
jgi:hypothetical protein